MGLQMSGLGSVLQKTGPVVPTESPPQVGLGLL